MLDGYLMGDGGKWLSVKVRLQEGPFICFVGGVFSLLAVGFRYPWSLCSESVQCDLD